MKRTISFSEKSKEASIICGHCGVNVHPFDEPKFCKCGNIQIDEERSTDKILYLKEHQPPQITVTSDYKPTFKEKILDMFKFKNKVC